MAAFAHALPLADIIRFAAGPVSWAARNTAKPGRRGTESWVIHASPARSRALLDRPKEAVADVLLADFFAASGACPVAPVHLDAHSWLYALPAARKFKAPLFDRHLRIGLAGDYLHSARVEGAWLSGRQLAAAVLER
jgi:predicted NAD/FAD-dependent oxidoreductase